MLTGRAYGCSMDVALNSPYNLRECFTRLGTLLRLILRGSSGRALARSRHGLGPRRRRDDGDDDRDGGNRRTARRTPDPRARRDVHRFASPRQHERRMENDVTARRPVPRASPSRAG